LTVISSLILSGKAWWWRGVCVHSAVRGRSRANCKDAFEGWGQTFRWNKSTFHNFTKSVLGCTLSEPHQLL